jgi:hypothetical protein
LTLWVSGGCADLPVVAPVADGSPLNAKAGRPPQEQIWTSDDEYARVARAEVPGFAGFYLEDDGTPVILLNDHRQRAAAERYLAPQLARARRGRNAGAPQQPIVRKVTHDFADLKGWFDKLDVLTSREDVYMLDVDEVDNQVSVGVRDEAAIKAIRRAAALMGVPPGVLNVEIRRPTQMRATLQDWTSTLMGGYQIQGPPTAESTGECTYGFNALYQGMWMFVTASHCTYTTFAMGNTIIGQPYYLQGYEIGYEYADRGMYECAGAGTSCRRSDAAYIKLNGSRTVGQGKIAYTPFNMDPTVEPNLEVIGQNDIIRRYAGPLEVGTYLDKTGRTTGSTYGQIKEACVKIGQLICQDISSVWSDGGDSGAPMYVWLGNDQVELYGVLWGGPEGDVTTTYSSRLSGIERDLGTLTSLCAPGWGC